MKNITKLTCLLGLLFYVQVNAQKAEITIPSAIEISPRDTIRLYDVVETKNLDESMLEKLKEVLITVNSTGFIDRQDLIRKVKNFNSQFRLSNESKILKSKSTVSRMEIERKIKNHLLSKCATCEFTIQINSVPANIKSDWEIDTRIDMTKSILIVPVYSISDSTSKGQIIAEVKKFAQTPIVSQLIKSGDIISEDQIQYELRPIRSFSEVILNSKLIV